MDPFQITGCTRDTFNKWLERGLLRSSFETTTQGVRRKFSRENLLEMAFLSALAGARFTLSDAAGIVERWQKDAPKFYAINPITGKDRSYTNFNCLTLEALRHDLPGDMGTGELVVEGSSPSSDVPEDYFPAASLNLIWPGSIVRRIDKYLALEE